MLNNTILPEELIEWINQGKKIQIIDITHDNLLKNLKIKSKWIPVHKLIDHISELNKDIPLILSCRVGADSFIMMNILSTQYQMNNVFSLKSGFNGLEKLLEKPA
jgi:rhodanese-related sulfurtransferase